MFFVAVFFVFASNSSMIVSKICERQGNRLTENVPSSSSSSEDIYTKHKHLSIFAFLASEDDRLLARAVLLSKKILFL